MDILILAAVMLPLYATVGEYSGSLLQAFLILNLSIVFTMYLSLLLMGYFKFTALRQEKQARLKDE